MRINTNIAAFGAIRRLNKSIREKSAVNEHLASGLRITRASDDAAGLSVAASLNAGARILNQAARNINDGISLISIADGAMSELAGILQRGAELSEQAANGVYSAEQRQALQTEAAALIREIDRIAETTTFNGLNLLNDSAEPYAEDKAAILYGLKASWLANAEQLITTHYGLTADGATLQVKFDYDTGSSSLAYVQGQSGPGGTVINQELHINIPYFQPPTLPNGGTAPFYADRIITHEMAHAVMGRTMNFTSLPTWFIEGTAEFIHGADERVAGDVAAAGGGAGGATTVAGVIDDTWSGSSAQYSAGYAGVRYIHSRIKTAGGAGIKDVMDYLRVNSSADLDAALQNITFGAYAGGVAAFYTDFVTGGNGSTFIQSMNLGNADTGAIGGLDADGGPSRTATSVIPDTNTPTENPLTGFTEIFPTVDTTAGGIDIAAGQSGSDFLGVTINKISSDTLSVNGADLVNQPRSALGNFKGAIQLLAQERGKLGAFESRLSVAVQSVKIMSENYRGAQSRIEDSDVAEDTAMSLRADILTQMGVAVLAQANATQRIALDLLQG